MASEAEGLLGHKALAALDHVLGQKPRKDDHALSRLTMCLTAFRDEMTALQRGAGATHAERMRLERLNGVLSVVLGVHFPLGDVPWGELEKARGWLAELSAEIE